VLEQHHYIVAVIYKDVTWR